MTLVKLVTVKLRLLIKFLVYVENFQVAIATISKRLCKKTVAATPSRMAKPN